MKSYLCRTCGKQHDELPIVYGPNAPVLWEHLPEAERHNRAEPNADQCVVDGKYFFLRGRLEIPILQSTEVFCWLVWVSLSERNFLRTCELWDQPGREAEPPYFGWLQSSLPFYPETLGLKTLVHTRKVGARPFVELESIEHPLAVEQRQGITWERVQFFAEHLLH